MNQDGHQDADIDLTTLTKTSHFFVFSGIMFWVLVNIFIWLKKITRSSTEQFQIIVKIRS